MTDRAAQRALQIEQRLRQALTPAGLVVLDESHLHAGHAGAADGRSHFAVDVTMCHAVAATACKVPPSSTLSALNLAKLRQLLRRSTRRQSFRGQDLPMRRDCTLRICPSMGVLTTTVLKYGA